MKRQGNYFVKYNVPVGLCKNRRKGETVSGRKPPQIIMAETIKSYRELKVYKNAILASLDIFGITKNFPKEEQYSLTDQIRRSSRSVCANLGESWRKRRYKNAFIAKLSDAETEACETQVWLEISYLSGYIDKKTHDKLYEQYELILSQIVKMIDGHEKWLIKQLT